MKGRVLVIAGSDPSGGAGVQADIKTVTALGGYAAAAITALTVQNTKGVRSVHPVAPDVIRDQIIAVLDDIGADAIKIGMIGSVAAGEAILGALSAAGCAAPLVLDPVLAATSGDRLDAEGVADFMRSRFAPHAALIAPNADEAAELADFAIRSAADQRRAGEALVRLGAGAALVKGGHLAGENVVDLLVTREGVREFTFPRIASTSTHGTGCTLASAIAAGFAQGLDLEASTARAIRFVREAIRTAPGLGGGAGPLNHAHTVGEY